MDSTKSQRKMYFCNVKNLFIDKRAIKIIFKIIFQIEIKMRDSFSQFHCVIK